jgi:hypothetical protein
LPKAAVISHSRYVEQSAIFINVTHYWVSGFHHQ